MNIPIEQMKSAYDKHQNLKVAASELGMKWQTLYWHLKKHNHPIIGNKSKYGSPKDKLASLIRFEDRCEGVVPSRCRRKVTAETLFIQR